jgi:hypothetical protein
MHAVCGDSQILGQVKFTKVNLHIDVVDSIRDKQVMYILEEVIALRGYFKVLLSDNGLKFVSAILLK